MNFPCHETILLVVYTFMYFPFKSKEPIQLHRVQFSDGNIADLCPGSILKRVIIEELAA
jgi:hypothetical protein